MDSERKHSAYLDDVRRRATPGDFTPAYITTNGDQLAFTPNVSGNIWTTYRLPFGLTVGGGVQYVGSSYLGRPDDATRIIPNGKFGKLPAYTVVNLMASYEVRPGVDLRFNVDNVADTKYVVSTNWAATRAAFGTSRAYRISTSFKF
jgi:catecholate siderophore receptor